MVLKLSSSKREKMLSQLAKESMERFEAKQAKEEQKKLRRVRDNRIAIYASVGAVLIAILAQVSYFAFGPGSIVASPSASAEPSASSTPTQSNSSDVPDPALAEGRKWEGTMAINGANLEIRLDGDLAPQAVANFLKLSQDGFYNNVNCHRLTTAGIFVLQCGDPNGDGTGGPGYNWGPIENAPADSLYKKGVLAMARVGGDGFSMGSQFFIVYEDSTIPSDAAGGYTVFGEITGSLVPISEIIAAGEADGDGDGKPVVSATLGAIRLE